MKWNEDVMVRMNKSNSSNTNGKAQHAGKTKQHKFERRETPAHTGGEARFFDGDIALGRTLFSKHSF